MNLLRELSSATGISRLSCLVGLGLFYAGDPTQSLAVLGACSTTELHPTPGSLVFLFENTVTDVHVLKLNMGQT